MTERPLNIMRDHAATEAFLSREQQLCGRGWDPKDAARYAELYQIQLDARSPLSEHEKEIAEHLEREHKAPSDFGIFEAEDTDGVKQHGS